MKECSRKSVSPTTTLHHEGKLTHASFPYSTSTTALQKTILHNEGNLMHASFPSERTRTCQLLTTMLYLEG